MLARKATDWFFLNQWGIGLKQVSKKDPTIQFKVDRALERDPDLTNRLSSTITTLEQRPWLLFSSSLFYCDYSVDFEHFVTSRASSSVNDRCSTVLNVNFESLIVQWVIDFDLYYVEQICVGYQKYEKQSK